MASELYVHTHDRIDEISSNVYGHFAEHLGRCIYGGVWVGDDADVEHEDGIRTDTVDILGDLDLPVLRWPGGCFADDYHWEDGVGPREDRPRRRNLHWAQGRADVFEESNEFGTDEFVRLCDMLDTEPYLASNVGTGDPDEALNWAEYCNYDGDTELAARRRENDQTGDGDDGYDVKWWGIGNENWGCGGRYRPEDYADQYRRYANYMRTFDRSMNPDEMELVAVGHINDDWNRRFLDELVRAVGWVDGAPFSLVDHLAVHRYYDAGGDTDFDDEQYYKLFARAKNVARDVDDAKAALDEFAPQHDIGVIVDEWGVWHPEATADNGLEQENTVRDALSAALVLDDLNARADVVPMANIAQTVNVLQCLVQTDEEDAWPTPTYRLFEFYERHMGATSLRTVVDADVEEFEDEDHDAPLVTASASESDGEVTVTVSNLDLDDEDIAVHVDADDLGVDDASVLFDGQAVDEHSTKDNADEFEADAIGVEETGDGEFVVDAPAASVVALTLSE